MPEVVARLLQSVYVGEASRFDLPARVIGSGTVDDFAKVAAWAGYSRLGLTGLLAQAAQSRNKIPAIAAAGIAD
jgi:hypothetical protein